MHVCRVRRILSFYRDGERWAKRIGNCELQVVQEQELFSVVFFCWVCRFVSWRIWSGKLREVRRYLAVLALVACGGSRAGGEVPSRHPTIIHVAHPFDGDMDMPVCGSPALQQLAEPGSISVREPKWKVLIAASVTTSVPVQTPDSSSTPQPYHMLRRSALSLARVARRPYSAMASQTPVEDTIREKVGPLHHTSSLCLGIDSYSLTT